MPFAAYAVHSVATSYGSAVSKLPAMLQGALQPRLTWLLTEEGMGEHEQHIATRKLEALRERRKERAAAAQRQRHAEEEQQAEDDAEFAAWIAQTTQREAAQLMATRGDGLAAA